jgi:hypothetical protein
MSFPPMFPPPTAIPAKAGFSTDACRVIQRLDCRRMPA